MSNNGTKSQMTKEENIDIEDMFHNIWQFRETMLICEKPQKISSGVCKHLWVPHLTLCAFVCELEMKYIYFNYTGKLINSHDLNYIFKVLSQDIKIEIINKVRLNETDFIQLLQEYSLIFEQWRYKYEYKKIEIVDKSFLQCLEQILYDKVSSIRLNN